MQLAEFRKEYTYRLGLPPIRTRILNELKGQVLSGDNLRKITRKDPCENIALAIKNLVAEKILLEMHVAETLACNMTHIVEYYALAEDVIPQII